MNLSQRAFSSLKYLDPLVWCAQEALIVNFLSRTCLNKYFFWPLSFKSPLCFAVMCDKFSLLNVIGRLQSQCWFLFNKLNPRLNSSLSLKSHNSSKIYGFHWSTTGFVKLPTSFNLGYELLTKNHFHELVVFSVEWMMDLDEH